MMRMFLYGSDTAKPHVRIERELHTSNKFRLTVSETGSPPASYGPDGRSEKGIALTPAELKRLAFLLLAEIEGAS